MTVDIVFNQKRTFPYFSRFGLELYLHEAEIPNPEDWKDGSQEYRIISEIASSRSFNKLDNTLWRYLMKTSQFGNVNVIKNQKPIFRFFHTKNANSKKAELLNSTVGIANKMWYGCLDLLMDDLYP